MTEAEYHLLTQQNMIAILKYMIRLHCRHEITKAMLIGLYSEKGADVAKLVAGMDEKANEQAESILLRIGDTDPTGANLLGVEEFLRKLE